MRLLLSGEPIAWRMVWIDLRVAASGHRPSVLSLMARLNERRGELERRPAIAVFLLPQGWEPQVAAAAPDLWHVRQASVAVPFGAASPPASQPIEGGAEASAPCDPVRLGPAVEPHRRQARALLTRLSMAFPDIATYRKQLAWLDQQETAAHD